MTDDTNQTRYAGNWYDEGNAGQYLAWFQTIIHGDLEGHDELELEARAENVTQAEKELLK